MDIVDGKIEIEGSPEAEENLRKLLGFMSDPGPSNRDWATFILSQTEADTAELRAALVTAAEDADEDVRDEAILGLARRADNAALSKLQSLLNEKTGIVLLEAAEALGEPSLLPKLEAMREWNGGDLITREQLERAIEACRSGVGCIDMHESGLPGYRSLRSTDASIG